MRINHMLVMSVICFSTGARANNVITKQNYLSSNQIEWINKHRSETKVGTEFQFVYFRESTGFIWSASLNEYRKSKYYLTQDLQGFFIKEIEKQKDAETKVLAETLDKASSMLFDLIDQGMSEKTAITIVKHTYPKFSIVNNIPVVRSIKLPMVKVTIN